MRIIIIGAVAAGTSAAAKARRNAEDAEIIVYEKGEDISYSSCGMPYALDGEVEREEELTPRGPAFFRDQYNVEVRTRHEVIGLMPALHQITVRDVATGTVFTDRYDRLVLATGARAAVPPLAGREREHVFTLRTMEDLRRIRAYLEQANPRHAAIVGTGFIGLEMCESLHRRGLQVTLFEMLPQVTPGLDPDMAVHVQAHLEQNGVAVHTGASVQSIGEADLTLSDGRTFPADLVLLSTGVKPNSELAAKAGAQLGVAGAIHVDERMRTSLPDVYACGDCAEQFHRFTGKPVYRPLGSTANKTGRIAGDSLTGGSLTFQGILGTGIFRVLGLTVALTGLSEREARAEGFSPVVCHNIKPNRPTYLRGREMILKGIADRDTGRMLGAQIVGFEGVDKRIDVLATAITFGARAEDLFHLDLAYAPPFSTTKDPVQYTGMILENALHRGRPLLTATELDALKAAGEPVTLIDARAPEAYQRRAVPGAENLPLATLRQTAQTLDPERVTVTYCNKGTTGNAAQNVLLGRGFRRVYNLSGGEKQYAAEHSKPKQP